MQANDLRKGSVIRYNGELYVCLDFHRGSPGNKRAFVQASFKGLKNGRTFSNKFASDEEFERANLEPRPCQYLYKDGEGYHFMDMETYDQVSVPVEKVGDFAHYLKENMEVEALYLEEEFLTLDLPASVELKVTSTVPGVKGDSVSNTTKPATLETGIEVLVPLFIKEGDTIKVDTRSGEYVSRA